jgi:hypothetical protein
MIKEPQADDPNLVNAAAQVLPRAVMATSQGGTRSASMMRMPDHPSHTCSIGVASA